MILTERFNAVDLRPKLFSEVIGQDKVVRGIQNYLKNNTYPTVSAFVGASGSGKSTLARLVAKALLCENPTITEKGYEPCNKCMHCLDVEKETFNFVRVYNGSDLVADTIRKLDEEKHYTPLGCKYNIILVEEAQLCKDPSRLLQVVESTNKNTFWFLTSTDKSKFQTTYDKGNKAQEKSALRSRLCLWNIEGIKTKEISDYLFNLILKFDPDGELPETIYDVISLIAENSRNNLRASLNDLNTCLNAECYTEEEVISLFGYVNEKQSYEVLFNIVTKNKEGLLALKDSSDIEGQFRYFHSIITNIILQDILQEKVESWQDNFNKKILATGNLLSLSKVFENTHTFCGSYFNKNIFFNYLCDFYKENKKEYIIETKPNIGEVLENTSVKKVKKIKKT